MRINTLCVLCKNCMEQNLISRTTVLRVGPLRRCSYHESYIQRLNRRSGYRLFYIYKLRCTDCGGVGYYMKRGKEISRTKALEFRGRRVSLSNFSAFVKKNNIEIIR